MRKHKGILSDIVSAFAVKNNKAFVKERKKFSYQNIRIGDIMRRIVAIGGGELRGQSEINEYIVSLVDRSALGEGRTKPYAVFLPQASHESKPYTNSFFKVFSKLKCKADVILYKNDEMSRERISEKLSKADIIYIGGGDYKYMADEFERMGVGELITNAYERGAVIAGNSAGAMYLFERSLSDYLIERGESDEYAVVYGISLVKKNIVCHADEEKRRTEAERVLDSDDTIYVLESEAKVFFDGECVNTVTARKE